MESLVWYLHAICLSIINVMNKPGKQVRFVIQNDQYINTIQTDSFWCIMYIIWLWRFNHCSMTINC